MGRTARSVFVIAVAGSALLGAVGPVPVAQATTIGVTTAADEYGSGSACSLREAIKAANDDAAFGGCPAGSGDDLIVLPGGTYALTIGGTNENANATGDLDLTSNLTISGAGAPVTAVDAGGLDRVFDVDPSNAGITASLSGLTVRGGRTDALDPDGGGIQNHGTLNLSRVSVTGNEDVDDAGGIMNEGMAAVLTVVESAISGNTAVGEGGTQLGSGGGVRNLGGATATLTNVTISGNTAEGNGGGIDRATGLVTLHNVTVTANTASAGVPDSDSGGVDGDVTVRNSIIAGNTDASASPILAPDCDGPVTSEGYNLIGDDTGCTFTASTGDKVGTGAVPVDPLLGPLADNGGPTPTHALLSGSPAIGGGNPAPPGSGGTACEATDQRGLPRNCDIGAYELVLCAKVPVNRIGTEGKDSLVGTSGPDGLLGFGKNDKLSGKSGKDGLCGGPGKDTLKGGGSKDRLDGGPGKDLCVGQAGKDKARACENEKTIP